MIGKTNSKQAAGNAAQEFVNVQLSTNQSSHGDLAGAKVTVSYGTYTKDYTWSGSEITFTIPAYINYTVSFGSVEGYKTPASVSHSAIEDNARTIEAVYQCELVKVSVSADDGSSVNGAVVTINGKSHTWNGKVVEQKVPFGTSYSVSVGDFSGYIKPSSKSYTANSVSREVSMVYAASSLVVNILSNQGTDATIGAVQATVKYGSTSVNVVSGQRLNIPSGSAITITFPEVDGYLKPEDISFTHSGGAVTKSGEYKCELLTVNVSADEGVPTGFEITISKKEVLGANGEYTRLEYIESTGTQWIDTGFKPNQDTRVVFSGYNLSTSSGWTFGTWESSTLNQFAFSCNASYSFRYGTTNKALSNVPIGELNVDFNKNSYSLNGTTGSLTTQSFSCTHNMYLFAINANGSVSSGKYTGRLHLCKIYDNGILVRDYIPVLRSDGIVGLYDAVNDTFISSSGSGNFIAGNKYEEVVATQISATGTYKIPFDISYSVRAGNVNGYITPSNVTRISSSKSYIISQQYVLINEIDLSLQDVYGNSIQQTTANCYVVKNDGIYKFPIAYGNAIKNGKVNTAAFTNNGGADSHRFVNYAGYDIWSPYLQHDLEYIDDAEVFISNSDIESCISNCTIINGDNCKYIQFKVSNIPNTGGNILLSLGKWEYTYNRYKVYWSWHIWLWPHDLTPVEITNSTGVKYNIMPVNLASKYDDDGVHIKNWFYQWGRSTPLLCPAAYNSTSDHSPGSITKSSKASYLSEGLMNPTTFFYNSSSPYNWFGGKSYYNLWDSACTTTGTSDNDTVKTVYDPCPVGWKVPNGNVFTGFSQSNVVGSFDGGWKFKRYSGDTVGVFFPASGCREGLDGSLYGAGMRGIVWFSSAYSQIYANGLYLDSGYVNPQVGDCRAYGFSVRPVQDDITKIDTI